MRQKVLCQDELTDEQIFTACLLTARQYGEVVLPDASIRAESWYFSQKIIPVQGGYGTCFCRPGTDFIACWRGRGTRLIGAVNLSPVTKLVVGTGAVSGYNLSRSKKFITVQDINWGQMRVSGCNNRYEF